MSIVSILKYISDKTYFRTAPIIRGNKAYLKKVFIGKENLLKVLLELKTEEKLFDTITSNLECPKFLSKEWPSCALPQLNVYNNEKISIGYNLFFPEESGKSIASDLAHHHGCNHLFSTIVFGEGYRTMTFKLQDRIEIPKLRLLDDFEHGHGDVYHLPMYTPHIIFKPKHLTISGVIWVKDHETRKADTNRINYLFKDSKIIELTEDNFGREISSNLNFTQNSEQHIQGFCYLFQEVGYQNQDLFKKILDQTGINPYWMKWIKKLLNSERIEIPKLNNLNTLGTNIYRNDVLNSLKNR